MRNLRASLQWVKSIMFTVVIVLLLCSILLGFVLLSLRQNLLASSQTVADYLQESIDSKVLEILKYRRVLELDPTITSMKKLSSKVSEVPTEYYDISVQLRNYTNVNSILESVQIYFRKADLIVGDLGCFEAPSYYKLDNWNSSTDFEKWSETLKQGENGFAVIEHGGKNKACYINAIIHNSEVVGFFLIRLNSDELLRVANTTLLTPSEYLSTAILLGQQVITQIGNSDELAAFLKEQTVPAIKTQVSADSHMIYVCPSRFEPFTFLFVSSLEKPMAPLRLMLIICISFIIVIGLLALFISFILGRKNARPIEAMLEKMGVDPDGKENAFALLEQNIEKLLSEKSIRVGKLQEQQDMISGLFLNFILSGEVLSESEAYSVASRYGLTFENPYFTVSVITKKNSEDETLRGDILSFLGNKDVIVSYRRGSYVLLFNTEEIVPQQELASHIEQMVRAVFADSDVVIGIGLVYDQIIDIPLSHSEAQYVASSDNHSQDACCYSMDLLPEEVKRSGNELHSLLIQQKFRQAKALVTAMYKRDKTEYANLSDLRDIYDPVVAVLLKAMEQCKRDGLLAADIDTSQIFTFEDISSLALLTAEVIDILAKSRTLGEKPVGPSIAERAKGLIEKDFTNPALGLYYVAAQMGISNSYLSTTYKATFGIGVAHYINQLRIDLAKELISSTDMTVKDIALAIGFSSDISFIRVFKRHESHTPGMLRKQ
ncbi:MAG: helix-turn-helix domain-containing protein [Sphaerochaeta sp.]|nr:helix-turn-helix domain-containing protein [Sphaerochaeta sp.]